MSFPPQLGSLFIEGHHRLRRLGLVLFAAALLLLGAAAAHAGIADEIERAVSHDPRATATEAQAALAAARAKQDQRATLLALRRLVKVRADIDETTGTRALINEALALAEQLQDNDAHSELLLGDAMISHVLGEGANTDTRFARAVTMAEQRQQPFHLARALIQHARWYEAQGRSSDAMAHLNRAYSIAQAQGDRYAMSRALNGVAGVLSHVDRLSPSKANEAIGRYRAALELIDPEVYRTYAVRMWHNLAGVLMGQGGPAEVDEARSLVERALAMAERLDYGDIQNFLLALLVEAELKAGRPDAALAALARASQPRTGAALPAPLPASLRFRLAVARADALSRQGQRAASAEALDAARKILAALSSPRWAARYHEIDAAVAARHGDYESAFRALGRLREAEKAMITASNNAAVTELRTRFDLERKEYENSLLRAREAESEARRGLLIALLAASVLLFGGLALWWRQRLKRRLRAANALKAAVVDHAMEAIVTADANGRIVEFNPAAEAMFGQPRAHVVGQSGELLLPEGDRPRGRALLAQLQHGGDAAEALYGRRWPLRGRRADGSEFPVEAVLWRAEVDGVVHYTASVRDVTEQHRSAETIERQRNELRQSEKLTTMGSLLAGVAHELNNPLAVVMGRASLLEEMCAQLPQGGPLQVEAQRVREAALRCSRIVRTFLNMARQRSAPRGEVQLNDVVQGAAEMLGYVLRTHAIRVELTLAPDLPAVWGDGDQLGQVVLNLFVNAQQAMSGSADGARRLRIETGHDAGSGEAGRRIWLRVADTGPGVPPEVAERIFMPFFTTKGEGMGTGMGLAVSRAIAHEHGGDLELEPSAQGASFLFWLPLEATIPPRTAAPLPQPAAEAPDGARVLVVDDEPELADVMRAMLESAGFDVTTAESGEVAIEMLQLGRFDAIVSDLRMPDTDGAALWRAVKAHQPALAERMLFVTGDTLSLDASRLLAETGCQALEKPFSGAELVAKVRALLGRWTRQEADEFERATAPFRQIDPELWK
ncbi:ATP-binding protein [Aquabacterium humicola]|uniref:ATP-binding protein n=1 Tax=Aquabacterium humicola TaxID=3237377 RepID=UPI0025433441|nr:ATP-binding protein [Rubrivivax pictus]